ncbi:rifin [Plasmodium sp. gorilla clade G1]|nr:rifin [Plasmodium sp. gorilla clade G1]
MKVHYSKILLFSFLLNILAHNKNKPYITTHTPTATSRLLIECNIYMPNYYNDSDMNSVKENFHKQTEQRFHEYDKRMIKNRQKCKEKCDKDIQKIILKDKMEKSLVEKVEKVCLKCGCGLGGVATSVGVLGTAVVNVFKTAAMDAAIDAAIADGVIKGAAMGGAKGVAEVIAQVESQFRLSTVGVKELGSAINITNYTYVSEISHFINLQHNTHCSTFVSSAGGDGTFCSLLMQKTLVSRPVTGEITILDAIETCVRTIVSDAKGVAATATKTATDKATAGFITKKISEVNATYASFQTAIIASVVAILVIVLIMLIIYLFLRYRRKKKMNKKLQYTKLLNQ